MRLPGPRASYGWTRLRDHDIEELWDQARAPHVASAYLARLDLVRDLVLSLLPVRGRVLDVGCAQGTLGLQLAEVGHSVTLLDVDEEALTYARERHERGDVEWVCGSVDDLEPGRSYDVVVATEVLEHLRAPALFLSRLRELTRPGGHVILTTPNARYLFSRLPTFGTAHQATIDSAPQDSQDGDSHRYLYSEDELGALVRGVGLRVVARGSCVPFWIAGHLKTRHVHRLLHRVRGRIVRQAPGAVVGVRRVRRVDACLWIAAQRPGCL